MNALLRREIALRCARDIAANTIVNLGRGLPTSVAEFIDRRSGIVLQSENGIIGMGAPPIVQEEDPALTDAGKRPVTLEPGGAVFDLVSSFEMIRGGHIDLSLLGAFQVAANGDLANWAAEDDGLAPAIGGAMDLAVSCRETWVLMTHADREGRPKFVERCTMPLTAAAVVKRVYTDIGTFAIDTAGVRIVARRADIPEAEFFEMTPVSLFGFDQAEVFMIAPNGDLA